MASAIKATCLPTMDVDWVSASASGDGNQNVPATPKKFAKPDVTNSKGKRKIAFDPFADSRGLHQALVLRIKRNLTVRTELDVSDHAYLVLACAN